jgi:nucleotide-binding universal stress UspA family protein
MPEFKRILFPVDFSSASRAVQPIVVSTASHFQASLTLLHVVYSPAIWYGSMEAVPPPVALDVGAVRDVAQRQLASYCETAQLSQIDRIVRSGDPATEITTFAKENQIDLIMMPTQGTGKFRAALLGSVTAKVLHDVDCAVWTAAHAEHTVSHRPPEVRSILCAIDLVPESAALIRCAKELANSYGATLRLVHAAPALEIQSTTHPRNAEFRRYLLDWSRERICVLQRTAHTDLEVCLEAGSPAGVVRAAALHHDADLVVIGRGREQKALGSLRSNAYAIICEAPCPVLRM